MTETTQQIEHYHSPNDRKFIRDVRRGAPTEFEAYQAFSAIVGREDGEVPLKYRELIAIAVGLTTQCSYCLETHTAAAKRAGASEEELAEVALITGAMRAGAGVAHSMLAMKLFKNS